MRYWSQYPAEQQPYQHGVSNARRGCFPSTNPYRDGSRAAREFERGWQAEAARISASIDARRAEAARCLMAAGKRKQTYKQMASELRAKQLADDRARWDKLAAAYNSAIINAEGRRSLMGDKWAHNTIAYYQAKLHQLGERP